MLPRLLRITPTYHEMKFCDELIDFCYIFSENCSCITRVSVAPFFQMTAQAGFQEPGKQRAISGQAGGFNPPVPSTEYLEQAPNPGRCHSWRGTASARRG